MRTAIYTRVSTDVQAEEGFSLDAQLARLRSYCESQGWTIAAVYTDEGVSAKTMDRPELQRLLADMRQRKFDVVLVYRLDRLTRTVRDLDDLLQEFDRHGVGFKSATEVFDTTTAIGRLFITIVAALAQWERENLGERTRLGLVEATKQGHWSGGRSAFGYDYVDGRLVPNEIEAPVVREIFRRYVSGEGSVKLLQWLNNPDNPQPAPNKRWTQWSLKYLLRNPLYAGYVRFGYRDRSGHRQQHVTIARGQHEAIIDEDTWAAAERMRERRRAVPGQTTLGSYSLTGLLFCSQCGARMSGITKYRRSKAEGRPYRSYICQERMHSRLCRMPQIREEKLESAVLDAIEQYYHDLSNSAGSLIETAQPKDDERAMIDAQLSSLEARRKRWMDAFEAGAIDTMQLRDRLQKLNDQESALRKKLDSARPQEAEVHFDEMLPVLARFRDMWEYASPDERRDLLRYIVQRIDVQPDGQIQVTFIH